MMNGRAVRALGASAFVVLVAGALLAGTTRTTTPHMPQGGATVRSSGDFVSAAAGANGGLDTFYRYFIEVPAGSTKIQVDLWDADIGEGAGANEDDAGRDRSRGTNPTWNTTATYTLIDPNGTTRTPRFTSGTVTGVNDLWGAVADNIWLTFYSATGNTVADDFTTSAFTNNTGNNNWATNWLETDNDGAGAAAGSIQVTGGALRIGDVNDSTPAPQIQREADLLGTPGLNMGMAYLTFSYTTANLDDPDQLSVQVSGNGGGSWTNLETFSNDSTGTRSYDITPFIANNTRIRFLWVGGFTQSNEFFFIDNVQISDGTVVAGHWELRVDESAGGDDINAIGIRAHDGNTDGTGTEMNVYAHSMMELGINPNNGAAATRTYTHFPWITRGCDCGQNDFDLDSTGTTTYTSQAQCISGSCTAGTFTQSFASGVLSGDDAWNRDDVVNFTTDQSTVNYGIWTKDDTISTYFNPGINGNYETVYVSNSEAAANSPTANPFANTFRIYLPTDASTDATAVAPAKPYLEHELTWNKNLPGPSTPTLNTQSTFTVTVRLVNPTPHDITFGVAHSSGAASANVITANVPNLAGLGYGGNSGVSQGLITSEPALNGNGNIVWNPGVVAGGTVTNPNVEILHYDIRLTPPNSNPMVITGLGSSTTTGTRAQYIDETGNTTQAASLNLLGPLCELILQVNTNTDVLVSSFAIDPRGARTLVEWNTASEAGTIGFDLYRVDGNALTKVNQNLLPANVGAPQGGRYVFADSGNTNPSPQYVLEEVTANGKRNRRGPFAMSGPADIEWNGGEFERTPRRRSGRGAFERSFDATSNDITSEAEVAGDAAKKKVVAVMVGVGQTGVVRVPASSLATLFGKTNAQMQQSIQKGDISVTSRGSAVAWTAPADASAVLFFGEKSDSMYANDRVYRIATTRGIPMKNVPVAAASGAVSSYTAVKDVEVDVFPASALPLNPDIDYWFWDFIISGDPGFGSKTFSIEATSLASSAAAQLDVRLQGAIDGNVHRAKVSVNGVPIGETSWSNFTAKTATLTIPAAVLREGANEVIVEGTSATPSDIFYIDGFTLRYPRLANAEGGALEMAAKSGATVAGGFASAPMVLDVTTRLKPSLLQGAAFASGNASFVNPATVRTLFFASTFVEPSSLRASTESPFMGKINTRADYVVITPPALRTDAASLADLRQREGLAALVVDLNEIYDYYSGGNPTPFAIRDFIAGASKWNKTPRYFALVGGGTDDYRGVFDSPGLMPPFMVKTADGIFASDSRFGDRNNDGLPEVAIGRIPVSSAAELRDYIRKLSNQRTSATLPILFSADSADGNVNFRQDSGIAETPLVMRPATRVYLDETGGPGGRTALIDAWQGGTPLVSWLGHGGLDQISSGGILTAGDAPSLTTASGTLPVMVAMTCTINRFEIGFVESLGAALTRTPDAGALAVWSASGLSVHNNASELQRTFMRLVATTPNARIGDLMVKSLATSRGLGETGSIYLLLGDPAIRITLPAETKGPTSTTSE